MEMLAEKRMARGGAVGMMWLPGIVQEVDKGDPKPKAQGPMPKAQGPRPKAQGPRPKAHH